MYNPATRATIPGSTTVEIDFDDIRHLIPPFVFNEYGQLTGNFVRRDEIVCVHEDGRVQVWLNRALYEERDSNGLIVDYDERRLFPET